MSIVPITNELMPLAGVNNNMLMEVIKQQIGERVFDMGKTWKSDSLNAGRKQRLKGFASLLGNAARDIVMSNFSNIVMGSALTLYTFDWNKTDKQLQDELAATETAMYGAAGRLTAQGVVRMTGIQTTKKARHLYPQIDPSILLDIDEENRDEIKSAIAGMLTTMRSSMQKNLLLNSYMSGRKMMGYKEKKDKDGKDEPREPWILSDQLEKFAESSGDKNIKAFFSNLKEEAEDAVFDMGYMVCNGVTQQYTITQAALKATNGPARLVRYTPDTSEPLNYTFVQGNEEAVKTAINGARLQQVHLSQKDIGSFALVGIQQSMKANLSERILTAMYYSGINGATSTVDGRSSSKSIKISNIKKTVDWQKMKTLLKPVMSGPIKVTAKLSDGHELQGYFASEAEGKSFFTPIIEQMCIGELVSFQEAAPSSDIRKKLPLQRYEVSSCKLFVSDTTSDEKQGKYIARDGKMKRTKTIKIKMNGLKGKPEGIDQTILYPWGQTL